MILFFQKSIVYSGKKQFGEADFGEEVQSSEDAFRVDYIFLVVVEMAITSVKNWFDQMKIFESVFGFLFGSIKLKALDESELQEHCTHFHKTFSHGSSSDVDCNDLYSELTLPDLPMGPSKVFEFVENVGFYPNVSIAYRILLTTPMTVASAERNFSKLKLLKNYLRSSMSQEMSNGLDIFLYRK